MKKRQLQLYGPVVPIKRLRAWRPQRSVMEKNAQVEPSANNDSDNNSTEPSSRTPRENSTDQLDEDKPEALPEVCHLFSLIFFSVLIILILISWSRQDILLLCDFSREKLQRLRKNLSTVVAAAAVCFIVLRNLQIGRLVCFFIFFFPPRHICVKSRSAGMIKR